MPWRWPEPLLGLDADERVLRDALLPILHTARDLGKQRVVRARANVVAGPINGAALTHEDVAGQHLLAAELLEAEPLRLGFAAVLGTAACLFVCHDVLSLKMMIAGSADDAGDLHFRIGLAVRALPQVVLAAAEFDDAHLVALAVALHGRDDFAAAQERRADLDAVALPDQQHLVELDVRTGLGRELLHAKDRALADAILLTTRRNYG